MGTLTIGAAFLVALLGQYLKSLKNVPTWAPVAGMGLVGIAFYGLRSGWPAAPEWGAIENWLDSAWPWAVALPGMSSAIGLHPTLKTDVR